VSFFFARRVTLFGNTSDANEDMAGAVKVDRRRESGIIAANVDDVQMRGINAMYRNALLS